MTEHSTKHLAQTAGNEPISLAFTRALADAETGLARLIAACNARNPTAVRAIAEQAANGWLVAHAAYRRFAADGRAESPTRDLHRARGSLHFSARSRAKAALCVTSAPETGCSAPRCAREASIVDQVRRCRAFIGQAGGDPGKALIFSDFASPGRAPIAPGSRR
jgi:hypothetical protein